MAGCNYVKEKRVRHINKSRLGDICMEALEVAFDAFFVLHLYKRVFCTKLAIRF